MANETTKVAPATKVKAKKVDNIIGNVVGGNGKLKIKKMEF